MAKFFLMLCCLSAGSFLLAEANPFFFNIQKSYATQPVTTGSSQRTVSQTANFGLGDFISKWLTAKQIFTNALLGVTQRPRTTQRPIAELLPVYMAMDLDKEGGSSNSIRVPAEEIETTTKRITTTTINFEDIFTTDRTTTSFSNELTLSTTDRTSTSTTDRTTASFSNELTSLTTDRTSTTTSSGYIDEPSVADEASTTDNPSTTDNTSTTDETESSESTGPSTTVHTTTSFDFDTFTNNRPTTLSSLETTTQDSTSTTSSGYKYTKSSTTRRTTTPNSYEYPDPSNSIESENIRPTTYRPIYRPVIKTTTTTEEPGRETENENITGEENNTNKINANKESDQISNTYLPPVSNRFYGSSAISNSLSSPSLLNNEAGARNLQGSIQQSSLLGGLQATGQGSIGNGAGTLQGPIQQSSILEGLQTTDQGSFGDGAGALQGSIQRSSLLGDHQVSGQGSFDNGAQALQGSNQRSSFLGGLQATSQEAQLTNTIQQSSFQKGLSNGDTTGVLQDSTQSSPVQRSFQITDERLLNNFDGVQQRAGSIQVGFESGSRDDFDDNIDHGGIDPRVFYKYY